VTGQGRAEKKTGRDDTKGKQKSKNEIRTACTQRRRRESGDGREWNQHVGISYNQGGQENDLSAGKNAKNKSQAARVAKKACAATDNKRKSPNAFRGN